MPDTTDLETRLSSIEQTLSAITERLSALENRPNETEALSAVNTDLDDLKNRINSIEQAPASGASDPSALSPKESAITRQVIADWFGGYFSKTDDELRFKTPVV